MAAKRAAITYAQAGVSIGRGDQIVDYLKKSLKGIGGFGGTFPLSVRGMKNPMLVASTDGVGTKLLVANACGRHDSIGLDLVAMVVNDLIVCGARPLFFLDYIAADKLRPARIQQVLSSILRGCDEAECLLLGGETAEMPGMYPRNHYDLAGFGIGIVDRPKMLNPDSTRPGDRLIGVASSGLHSNGYSLARKIVFERAGLKPGVRVKELGAAVGETLLTPTRIYVRTVMSLLKRHRIRSIAHITGGGIPGNLNRALASNCDAVVRAGAWERPPVFDWLARIGPVREEEMFKTFNMGLGLILVVPDDAAAGVLRALGRMGEKAWDVGEVRQGSGRVVIDER